MKESELAEIIIKHYEEKGYVTYKEVTAKGSKNGGTSRADIIMEKDGIHTGIETKVSFGLKVIQQAFTWKEKTNYVYICVPKTRMTSVKRFGYSVCVDYGIGIIEIDKNKKVNIINNPTHNPNPDLPKLYEEHKSEVAGISGEYITPFKLTKNKILKYIEDNGKTLITDLVKNIEHHYKNDKSGKQSIIKMIKIGVIPLKLSKEKGKYYAN